MSGTRFARTGRCRLFICVGLFVLIFATVAIFHNLSQQLVEFREKIMLCEQRENDINERLQSCVENKHKAEQLNTDERNEGLEIRRNLEQKVSELTELKVRHEKLQQSHKLLQNKNEKMENEAVRSKKQYLDGTNALEKELQSVRKTQNSEISLYKGKYESLVREKENLEARLIADAKSQLKTRIAELEAKLDDYQLHCQHKSKEDLQQQQQQQINKPLHPPDTTRNASPQLHSFDKPRNDKSFNKQVLVSSGLYYIGVKSTNKTEKSGETIKYDSAAATNNNTIKATQTALKLNNNGGGGVIATETAQEIHHLLPYNRSLIINSVENFQILPKPILIKKLSEETETQLKPDLAAAAAVDKKIPLPQKLTSTVATKKAEKNSLQSNAHIKMANNVLMALSSSSSTGLPPMNQRKLPENVAPIPANFEELLRNDQKAADKDNKHVDAADIDAAVEEIQKNDNEDGNNNRYANVVNDMAQKAAAANEDSGAHEIKDHDFVNDQNFNLPIEDDNNFFDGGGGAGNDKHKGGDDDDIVGAGGGDIAVKDHHHLLGGDNLNNEVAADQGKEFPDGLRLEEGNDEDEDEDDYSNLAARQQGEQAIRN